MNTYGPALWSRSLVVAVDVVVVIWLAAMLVLAGLTKFEIDRLGATADSMTQIAAQESQVASALGPLQSLPIGANQIASAQQQLEQAATRTQHDAVVTGAAVHDLANTAFLLVVLIALFPILVFYIPMRLTRLSTRRSVGVRRPAAT